MSISISKKSPAKEAPYARRKLSLSYLFWHLPLLPGLSKPHNVGRKGVGQRIAYSLNILGCELLEHFCVKGKNKPE